MSINLLQTVQENLGYSPLQKIDANTQLVTVEANTPGEERFSQAAIPAVLTALYKYSQTDKGADLFYLLAYLLIGPLLYLVIIMRKQWKQ